MHKTTGQWKLGLALSLVTALLWGMLPIALKLLLTEMDAFSITWFRFLAAALILGAFQARRGQLPALGTLTGKGWLLMTIAALGLAGNYLLYLVGLDYITPGAAQIVIQLAPMLLLLGGLIVFGERFDAVQWLGFGLLLSGMLLFFNRRLAEIVSSLGDYTIGILLIIVSAIVWAAYALAQKQLLRAMASENIMLMLYLAGVLLFLPTAAPASLLELDGLGIGLLVFASLNTLFAYGAFAEALDHWEASRVSAVLAITPLLTLGFMAIISLFPTTIAPEPLNALSVGGALLVVIGSMITALAGRRATRDPSQSSEQR